MLRTIQKNCRGIGDLAHAGIGHGENTQLVHRAETVLLAAQGAVAGVVVALKENRTVDHMLEHFRPGETAVLRDVTHQDQYGARLLGIAGQLRSAIPDLRHTAGGRRERLAVHHLNGVDNENLRFQRFSRRQDRVDIGFCHQPQLIRRQTQAIGAQSNLLRRLLTSHIERGVRRRQLAQGLQE